MIGPLLLIILLPSGGQKHEQLCCQKPPLSLEPYIRFGHAWTRWKADGQAYIIIINIRIYSNINVN